MKQMSFSAWAYIWGVLVAGLALSVVALIHFDPVLVQWQTFATFTLLAIGAQLFEAVAPNRHAYYPSYVFFFAGVLLLPPALFVLLVTLPHVVELIKARLINSPSLRDWYIQPFNIAMHIIAGVTARWMHSSLNADLGLSPVLSPVLVVTIVALTYVVVNNVLLGLALALARGISWRESGVLGLENVVSEMIMLCLGYVVAVLWQINHWLILPALSPLGLMYRALQVPRLKEEARTDSKTGLWNARHFNTLFNAELERATRFNRPVAFIMADLDLLRDINNTYGHLAGDAVLTGIGTLLRGTIRDYDIAGRFGGEEFAIVMPEVGPIEARALAERIRQAIEAARFEVATSATPISATMSFGVACFPYDATNALDLIHEADAAVYQAKHQGRNRVVCASDVPLSVKLELEQSSATVPADKAASAAGQPATMMEQAGAVDAPPADIPTAVPAVRAQRPRQRVLAMLLSGVSAAGLIVALLGLIQFSVASLPAIVLLATLALLVEMLPSQIDDRTAVSPVIGLTFASALIAGVPAVATVSAMIVLVHYFQRHVRPQYLAFTWSTHVLAGTAGVLLLYLWPPALQIAPVPLLVLPALVASAAYYLIETGLRNAAASLSLETSVVAIWRDDFWRLTGVYMLWCMVGICLAVAYLAHGLPGILVVALPILLLRYAQKHVLVRAEQHSRELQRLSQQLTRTNQELAGTTQTLRQFNGDVLRILANTLDARNPAIDGHAARVAEYAAALADELGLAARRIEQVRQAALLHDLGKIGIPEQVLSKPGPLSDVEYSQVKMHVTIGATFLETSPGLRHLAPFVRHHHERWDGAGYPAGLRAAHIPLEARILAVCEAVETLLSPQPYRAALSLAETLAEIERCAGTQFDPQIVAALSRVAARKGSGLFRSAERVPAAPHAPLIEDCDPADALSVR